MAWLPGKTILLERQLVKHRIVVMMGKSDKLIEIAGKPRPIVLEKVVTLGGHI